MLTSNVIIQAIITLGGIFLGGFALFKYMLRQETRRDKLLFDYLEKKNGHVERITERFNMTVDGFAETMRSLTAEIKNLNSTTTEMNRTILNIDKNTDK